MRIAYVVGGLPFGGVENWLFDLLRELSRREGVTALAVNLSGTGNKTPEFLEAGLPVLNLAADKAVLKVHRLDTALRLRAALRDFRPDVVHTMQFSADYFGRLASLGLGVPVITHIHNIKHERHGHRKLLNKALSYATDLFLAVSKETAVTVETDHNLAGRPCEVLYNAVDPERFRVRPADLSGEFGLTGPVVVGVGRYVPQKNFDLLLKSFAEVLKFRQDAGLLLVGEGGEREKLEGLIRDLGLSGRAVLTGYRRDVPAILRAARVLAMPSAYEGLPITHLEALFCGLPAVISKYVPSVEIAADSSLVCETEASDVAAKLRRLLTDELLHERMRRAALKSSEDYRMERCADRLLAIYAGMKAPDRPA